MLPSPGFVGFLFERVCRASSRNEVRFEVGSCLSDVVYLTISTPSTKPLPTQTTKVIVPSGGKLPIFQLCNERKNRGGGAGRFHRQETKDESLPTSLATQ
ncbi:hypothetical protein CDAR_173181 [Caerostris darwini]|uniref:Uncharacterized protein n=1 Tax=Caerostris darwini TaxID=1538125 RepID=A0AAV4WIR5_9ARAC|nr:hypothetical protein CDAR_173181 [Caerostris darwini]